MPQLVVQREPDGAVHLMSDPADDTRSGRGLRLGNGDGELRIRVRKPSLCHRPDRDIQRGTRDGHLAGRLRNQVLDGLEPAERAPELDPRRRVVHAQRERPLQCPARLGRADEGTSEKPLGADGLAHRDDEVRREVDLEPDKVTRFVRQIMASRDAAAARRHDEDDIAFAGAAEHDDGLRCPGPWHPLQRPGHDQAAGRALGDRDLPRA